jgi:predicted TPR repeat methyltransferase
MQMITSLLAAADAAAKGGRVGHARACYQQVLAVNSTNVLALQRLAWLEQDQGRFADAIELLKRLSALRPDDARVLVNLGVCLKTDGKPNEALALLRHATSVDPNHAPAYINLGLVLEETGDEPAAVAALQKSTGALKEFHLAALGVSSPPAICPPEYLVALFDGYADTFDNHLMDTLDYRGPHLLLDIVGNHGNARPWDVLDLGCGTGMAGAVFRHRAHRLIGVDLSARMLHRAAQRIQDGRLVYDTLLQLDAVAALEQHQIAFDLILAADVFIYIGDLQAVFEAATASLRPDGLLAFTTECADGSGDYQLKRSRRYAQSPTYIQRLTDASKLELVERRRAFLRRGNSGSDVEGDVYLLRKPANKAGGRLEPPSAIANTTSTPTR